MGHTDNANKNAMRGLWLSRELPFPANMGDKIYSGNLAKALAEAGADLTLVGLRPVTGPSIPDDWPIDWVTVSGKPNPQLRSLFSNMPLVAATYATPAYRRKIAILAKKEWDFVVFDQYGLGWALPSFLSEKEDGKSPVLVHVAHDHEASVVESIYRGYRGSFLKRVALWQNFLKARNFERKIASNVDLITAITEEDAEKFSHDAPGVKIVVLKPGYAGHMSPPRKITKDTPRRVILVGSFSWIAKQENLRQFVAIADPIFAERGIEFQVVGSMPIAFAAELTRKTSATCVTGFVDSIEPYFQDARIAVVPEVIGGGFKLKFLDYIFSHVPVATLRQAAAGLPNNILDAMLCSENLSSLAKEVADLIDRVPVLNKMQETAASEAQSLFRWHDRGASLLTAIQNCKEIGRNSAGFPG